MNPIYLDSHSTTPLDPRVLDAMMPYLTDGFGNASSTDHTYGHQASDAVERARETVADLVGARCGDIVFTGGATESDNLALLGTMAKHRGQGDHLITCVTEHKAVLDTARYLEDNGMRVTYLPVDSHGMVDLEMLMDSITNRTVMVSIMAANNEIGTMPNLTEIGKITRERGVLFHTDAAQAVGHVSVDVDKMNIDLMSFSAHKMYGPKGVGVLYARGIRPRARPEPLVHGGGQERGIRSGTLNVPGIVGFGKAADIASRTIASESARLKKLMEYMLESCQTVGGSLNGHPKRRLAHNLNICFPRIESKAIINSISKEVAISAGSACTTQTVEPSHVLLAIGLSESDAHSSIRIGAGRFNTEEDIRTAASRIATAVKNIAKFANPQPRQ